MPQQEHDIYYRVTESEDGSTYIVQPSSVTIQDMQEYIKELEGILIYWRKTMEFHAEKVWNSNPRFLEIQAHLKALGLSGQGETKSNERQRPDTKDTR